MSKKRILSGIQATGNLHIGNYLGAIRNWVGMQNDYESLLFLADLHAITVPHDPSILAENTYKVAASYLACGIDPKLCSIFIQSHVSAHSELTWLFNCITPISWLERMIQYKEKAIRQGESVNVGLLDYPVLQAADILLYEPDLVPVGEDQKQHIELARNIVVRYNHLLGKTDALRLKAPENMMRSEGARIMSLTDGTKKMSKSDPSEFSRIELSDNPDTISNKIKRCKTDATKGLTFDDPKRPECHNLLTLYMLLSGKEKSVVVTECQDMGWGQFKPLLTDVVVAVMQPIQQRFDELMREKSYLEEVLRQGNDKACTIANTTLDKVKTAYGFAHPV